MQRGWTIAAVSAVAAGMLAALVSTGAQARETVSFADSYRPGTIVIKTGERRLYLVMTGGKAVRYRVGVGRRGKQWSGRTRITRKVVDPIFSPPAEVKRDIPTLPDLIPPGPRNPLGPRAMTLARGSYAIHGTNRPGSVGGYVSYGCIRMYNRDIVDLFERVRVGTPVVVLP
ncbi:L,D-transpeptidase [Afifella pfennigii]|uniref:L,D-transpeptidase n=1 Tax=Afifella pfennigii TaxID=209897 RepID=UPI00047EAA0F|nr:L,D-transpeptidase [Afifella pfennigii]